MYIWVDLLDTSLEQKKKINILKEGFINMLLTEYKQLLIITYFGYKKIVIKQILYLRAKALHFRK